MPLNALQLFWVHSLKSALSVPHTYTQQCYQCVTGSVCLPATSSGYSDQRQRLDITLSQSGDQTHLRDTQTHGLGAAVGLSV